MEILFDKKAKIVAKSDFLSHGKEIIGIILDQDEDGLMIGIEGTTYGGQLPETEIISIEYLEK